MDLVSAGLQNYVHGGAATAEFGAHGIFFGLEFLNRVGRRQHDNSAESKFVVIDPIQQKIVV